ncbi:hypothetical protein EUTSA_v10022101mg [Eutrema salsugineum]|uniref:VQ domain-containing protein n=1 Tax=Eutrema salsugineum TaxID=72664 RepID=V4M6W7_EUTSA|nr:VQ motif-containing protein 20 [Eutrema salsugineum]ESQ48068.1 hypothetical protein EUTSA_v10022101mg [Eutrema salsugineum]
MSSTFNDHHHPHHPKREPNDNNSSAGVGIIYPPSPSPSPLLKLNKDSHVIKKPPSPSSSSSTAAKPRQPVIIYTNTPKIIHTNPKDFMSLVQKLTGMSRSDVDSGGTTDRGGKSINQSVSDLTVDRKSNRNRCGGGHNSYNRNYSGAGAGNGKGIFFNNATICEDSESSSVITTDENIGGGEHGQVNSSLPYSAVAVAVAIPPPLHPPPPPSPPPSLSMYDTAGINYGAYFSTFSIFPPAADNFLCGNQPFANFDDPLYFAPNTRSSFSSSSSSGFDGLTEFRDF